MIDSLNGRELDSTTPLPDSRLRGCQMMSPSQDAMLHFGNVGGGNVSSIFIYGDDEYISEFGHVIEMVSPTQESCSPLKSKKILWGPPNFYENIKLR